MTEALRVCPILELSEEQRAQYSYTPHPVLDTFLEDFGYTLRERRLVDAFYISPDRKIGVGVLRVDQSRVAGHFGVMRGVDLVELIAQSYLVLNKQAGKIDQGKPLFTGIVGMKFLGLSTPGAILNSVVQLIEDHQSGGYGWILRGRTIITEGEIKGAFTTDAALEDMKRRTAMLQARITPLFPFNG